MDEECEKVNLSALRQRFENDAPARHVEKRQTTFEFSKSQFEVGGNKSVGQGDVVQQRLHKPPPASAAPRRSSEADMPIKPMISPKPVFITKKPNIQVGSEPSTGVQGPVTSGPPATKKGVSLVEKHAKLFEHTGLSLVPCSEREESSNEPVLSQAGVGQAKEKPAVTPRTRILTQTDNDLSIQSKKKLFENADTNLTSHPKPAESDDQQASFGAVLSRIRAAETSERPRSVTVPPMGSSVRTRKEITSAILRPAPAPRKPTRTFAHDIYQEAKAQRMSAISVDQGEEVFGVVDFRTRGVIVGEEDTFIPRERLATDISQISDDSSLHDYEDVNSPTSTIPPPSPGSRPALPIPNKSPTTRNFLSSDDYSVLEHLRIRSWDSGTSSTKSNKSQLSQRSNSDECLYSRTYEVAQPAEYMDPADLFAKRPRAHVPGFPNVELDDYGYAVPQHTHLKTPLFMSRSLDGHTKFFPPSHPPPGVPKDAPKRQKAISGKKKKVTSPKVTSPKVEEWENFPHFVKKDEYATKSALDYVKTFRRKPMVRHKIGQAFSILRRHVPDDDDDDEVDGKDDDRQSNDSESQIDIKELQRRIRHVTSIKEKNQSIYERVRAFRERIYPQLFDYAVIIGLEMVNGDCQPVVLHKFPHHCDPEKTSIPEFCFPDKDVLMPVTKYDSENYSFVLTSCDGRRDYGYCKRMLPPGRGPRLPEVICIISPLGAHTLYSQVLDHAEKRRHVSSDYAMELIAATYGKPLPSLGRSIDINSMNTQGTLETLTLSRQEDTRLENVNFEYLFSCLGMDNVLQVFSAILLERRTIFSASKLSTLSNCIHALAGLLYPFQWQHTFIPVLPAALLDITCAPTPYIIGIMSPYLPQIDDLPTEEVLIIDLDKACLLRACGDETTVIPRKLQKALTGALTMAMEDSDGQKNVLISEAFVRLFVESIGHYEEHIATQQDGRKVFQKDSFCKAVSSKSLRMFLEWFCETQMFHIFIDDHVDGDEREKGLFDARITEYKQELASMPPTTWNNFREKLRNIGKAIKTNIKGGGEQKKKSSVS